MLYAFKECFKSVLVACHVLPFAASAELSHRAMLA